MRNLRRAVLHWAVCVAISAGVSSPGHAADQEPSRGQNLTLESVQNISRLFSITIRNIWIPDLWDAPGTANIVEFRPTIPFKLWDQPNLMRVTVPYRTKSSLGTGLNPVRVFDLIGSAEKWGLWGVGPTVNFGSSGGLVTDTFQAGPVAGFVVTPEKWNIGLLVQCLFSSQVAAMTLQPILAYQFAQSWTISLGELPFGYNFKQGAFAFVPLGLQLSAVAKIAQQPIRFFFNPQYNTKEIATAPQWTLTSGISFLVRGKP